MRKKFLGMILATTVLFGVTYVGSSQELEEVVETEDIETVQYLTKEDLSLLYTCKPTIMKTDVLELIQTEAWLLMKLGICEAGDKGVVAQYLAMMVVINRVKSKEFPNSVTEVIYQEGQFAVVTNGALDKAEPNADSHIALAWIEKGIDLSEGALYFEASSNTVNSWHNRNREFLYEKFGQRYYK